MDGWSWDDDAVEADTQAVPISITTDKLQGVPDDFNVKGGDNDVCIKIQKSGQKRILLERLVSSTLVAQFAPRYKDQLENWVPAAPAGPPRNKRQKLVDEARQLKTITVITKDEADVPIVDHCLAFLYGIQPPPLTARQLLRLHRMADYLSMVDVLDASMERILALQPSDIGIPDCIWMGYSSELPDDPKIADALRTLGKGGVFHHLHDMPAIMRDEQLKAQWLALPHAALLDLLRNPAFATDSEDSVLTACGMWADQYKLNKPQVRAVLDEVRLVQLSSTFLFTVLPQMDWVREHMLAAVEVMRVAGYADGDAFERKLLQNEAVLPILPAAWIRHDLRPPSSVDSHTPQQGAYFRWSIARDDIEAKMRHDAGQLISVLRMPKSLFTHGLIVTPSIRLGLQVSMHVCMSLHARHALHACALLKGSTTGNSPICSRARPHD